MNDSRKVYVIKNALKDGIRCVELVVETTNFIRVKWPTGPDGEHHFDKKDVRFTLEDAQKAVRAEAERKLAALKRQRAKLERIVRDGAKVKEDV